MCSKWVVSGVVIVCLVGMVSAGEPFIQDGGPDGIVSMEAEHFDKNVPQGDYAWAFVTIPTGFSGAGCMQAWPDSGGEFIINDPADYLTQSPRMDYKVRFVKTGTHFVWVRGYQASNDDNSFHVGLNGMHTPTADRGGNQFITNEWLWNGESYNLDGVVLTIDIPGPGEYIINVWMRENGFLCDKIVLTTNPEYLPEGEGPPESTRALPEKASSPYPRDEDLDVPRDVILSWSPGIVADTHDVYFGTAFDDVNSADAGSPLLVGSGQAANTYDPPGLLDYAQTYYWRIDEVNAAPDNTVFKGNVWSFTTEPLYHAVEDITVTASVPTAAGSGEPGATVDGSGLVDGLHGTDDTTMWSGTATEGDPVWLQFDFDRVYKLYGMHVWNCNMLYEGWLGFGFKDVTIEYSTEPNEWVPLGDYELDRGTSVSTYAGQRIDLDGLSARSIRINVNSTQLGGPQAGLSEIRFLYKRVAACEPQPADGETEVAINTTLSWRAGREAASHQVHFDTDSSAVADGTALLDTVAVGTYDLPILDLATTYYWKIVEVNEAETPSSWASDVWNFTTPAFVAVDDFESYDDEEGTRIYDIWLDGYGIAANGSLVGHENPPYAEEDIVISGSSQSMPFYYGTDGATTSEAELSLDAAQDWTQAGAQTLALYFRGELGNAPGKLYVRINGTPIDYSSNAISLAAPLWKQWNIDLASLGNTAKSVRTMTIGVSGSGTGLLYIDDIRLYREAPPLPGPAVDPGTANLKALYTMENSVADSSGNGYDGTAEVGSSFGPGPTGYGRALVLDGTSGHATLPIGSLIASVDSITVATWVNWTGSGTWQRIFDFGNDTDVYMFMTAQSGSGMRFAITTGSNAAGAESMVTADSALPGGWRHVAVTIDGATGEMVLYLDGLAADSGTAETLPSDLGNTTQNWIGNSQWEGDDTFLGSIDDFRIYDRALSDGEVRYLVGDR